MIHDWPAGYSDQTMFCSPILPTQVLSPEVVGHEREHGPIDF